MGVEGAADDAANDAAIDEIFDRLLVVACVEESLDSFDCSRFRLADLELLK